MGEEDGGLRRGQVFCTVARGLCVCGARLPTVFSTHFAELYKHTRSEARRQDGERSGADRTCSEVEK